MTDTTDTTKATPPAPVTPPLQPGYKTTEFWLHAIAIALSALFASGAIPTSGTVATIAVIAAAELSALGYTVSRTMVKTA